MTDKELDYYLDLAPTLNQLAGIAPLDSYDPKGAFIRAQQNEINQLIRDIKYHSTSEIFPSAGRSFVMRGAKELKW